MSKHVFYFSIYILIICQAISENVIKLFELLYT